MVGESDSSSASVCKYCKKEVKTGVKCLCGAQYHSSCAQRTCDITYKCRPNTGENNCLPAGVKNSETTPTLGSVVDFPMEAYENMKMLVSEQTLSNMLLREKIARLEDDLKREKSRYLSLELQFNDYKCKHAHNKKPVNDNRNTPKISDKVYTAADIVKGVKSMDKIKEGNLNPNEIKDDYVTDGSNRATANLNDKRQTGWDK